ncbi:MAG: hypothetical protein ACI8WT_000599 [Clostridium sp.]|jgi:hypothetical protein
MEKLLMILLIICILGIRIKITMELDKTGKLEKVFINEVYQRNKEAN